MTSERITGRGNACAADEMHCTREELECASGLTWILLGPFVAPRSGAGSLLSRPVIWHARQQGEQDLDGAKTSVCASPVIASQRTQYAMLSAFDHRVRVLHDFSVGRVTRCLDNVWGAAYGIKSTYILICRHFTRRSRAGFPSFVALLLPAMSNIAFLLCPSISMEWG